MFMTSAYRMFGEVTPLSAWWLLVPVIIVNGIIDYAASVAAGRADRQVEKFRGKRNDK